MANEVQIQADVLELLARKPKQQIVTIPPIGKVVIRELDFGERIELEGKIIELVNAAEEEKKKRPTRSAIVTIASCFREDGSRLFDWSQIEAIDSAASTAIGQLGFIATDLNFISTPAAEDAVLKIS